MKQEPKNEQVGDLLRQLREAQELSFGALAAKAGVAKSTVIRVERGDYAPTTDVLMRLCEALDASYEDLAELIGFDAAKVLPKPANYSRAKYGMSEKEAEQLESQFSELLLAHGYDPNQPGPIPGEDE